VCIFKQKIFEEGKKLWGKTRRKMLEDEKDAEEYREWEKVSHAGLAKGNN